MPRPALDDLLNELRRRANKTPRGRHAALALDALGEPDSSSRAPRPAFNWSALEPLVTPLGELAQGCEGRLWCDLVTSLLDLVPVPARKPALVLQLALYAPFEARAVLLAEYWHLLMAGARHDPAFTLAVALDVWGNALSNPPGLLAETMAAAASRAPQGSPWKIRRTGLRDRDLRSLMETALDALGGIPEAFDFVKGWGLVCLEPLLARAGLLDEAMDLAGKLSDRWEAREDTLRRLTDSNVPSVGKWTSLARFLAIEGVEEIGNSSVRRVNATCGFGSLEERVHLYMGRPARRYHPLHFQGAWLRLNRGAEDGGADPA